MCSNANLEVETVDAMRYEALNANNPCYGNDTVVDDDDDDDDKTK